MDESQKREYRTVVLALQADNTKYSYLEITA